MEKVVLFFRNNKKVVLKKEEICDCDFSDLMDAVAKPKKNNFSIEIPIKQFVLALKQTKKYNKTNFFKKIDLSKLEKVEMNIGDYKDTILSFEKMKKQEINIVFSDKGKVIIINIIDSKLLND